MLRLGDRVEVDMRLKYHSPPDWRTATYVRYEEQGRAEDRTAVVQLDSPCPGCPQAVYLQDGTIRVTSHAGALRMIAM